MESNKQGPFDCLINKKMRKRKKKPQAKETKGDNKANL